MMDKERRIALLEQALLEYIQTYGLTDLAREVMTVPPWSGTEGRPESTRREKAHDQGRKPFWKWRT